MPAELLAPPAGPLDRVADRLDRALVAAGVHVWRYTPDSASRRLVCGTCITVTIARITPDAGRADAAGGSAPAPAFLRVSYVLDGRSYRDEGGWGDPVRFVDYAAVAARITAALAGETT